MKTAETNTANVAGLSAEAFTLPVIKTFRSLGYLTATQKTLQSNPGTQKIFTLTNTIKADGYIEGLPLAPGGMGISIKYQDSEGTSDEKVFYEVGHIIKTCAPVPFVLLALGPHWQKSKLAKARQWLKDEENEKLLRVFFSIDETLKWASSSPRCTGVNDNGHIYSIKPFEITNSEQKTLW